MLVMIASDARVDVGALIGLRPGSDVRFVAYRLQTFVELIQQVADLKPDVLLVHADLLGPDDVHALRLRFPLLYVLLVCTRIDADEIDAMVASGAHGCLTYTEATRSLAKAIRSVRRGELWLPRAALAKLVLRLQQADDARAANSRADRLLTPRERQVAGYLRRGCSNKEIGRALGIKEDTVKKHLKHVFTKVGVRRRTQLLLTRT